MKPVEFVEETREALSIIIMKNVEDRVAEAD